MDRENRVYLYTPNLVRDWDQPDGYISFRRYVEDDLQNKKKNKIKSRLELLDSIFESYREKYRIRYAQNFPENEKKRIESITKKYRDGVGVFSRKENTGAHLTGYADVTNLRNLLMQVQSNYNDKAGVSKKKLNQLLKKIQQGEEALSWAREMDINTAQIQETLNNLIAFSKLQEAFFEGTYAHVTVSNVKGAVQLTPPLKTNVKGKALHKNEIKTRYRDSVKSLVSFLTYLGQQSVTDAEHEAGDLMYAVGVSDKPASGPNVHKVRYSMCDQNG